MKFTIQKPWIRWVGLVALFLLLGFTVLNHEQIIGVVRENYKQVLTQARKALAIQASYNADKSVSAAPAELKTSAQDGMQMVYVPAGEFLMGTNGPENWASTPAHKVYLDAFWIDRNEVTNAMYAKCIQAGKCVDPLAAPGLNPYFGKPAHAADPVIYVTWYDAQNYCAWAGRRLPSEAEWEKAARGTDGRTYPWGEQLPAIELLNFDGNIGQPIAADRYILGASPYGALNMAGNVREWVSDWFSVVYYRDLPYANPHGPESGTRKSLRGSSFKDGTPESPTFARFGHVPDSPGINRGFRCAEGE